MAYTTIKKPSDYFNTKLYTGNGSTQSITGVGFQPDFCWFKRRDNGTANHALQDSVRGVTKFIQSNTTAAEATSSNYLTSFNSDGFSLGSDGDVNDNGANHVAWSWLANGAGSANTDGSISSTVSANTTSGFSIVSYSGNGTGGATVGHGLGSALGLIILKCRDTAGTSWQMFHKSLGATKSINLEDTAAAATSTAYWNDTAPTSSVFSLGTGGDFNNGSRTYVAYCFAEKKGFSKFGSYTGNGSADGTFVYTGFKPAFLIVKRYNDAGYDWLMYDNKRQVEFNVVDDFLKPNLSDAETTGNANQSLDFLSNGVKFRGNGASSNGSGASYIYMCFAENPFVTSTGIPTTAR
jgi:hypothetical protein